MDADSVDHSYSLSYSSNHCDCCMLAQGLTLKLCFPEEGGGAGAKDQQTIPGVTAKPPSAALSSGQGVLHLPSAAVCVGVLPGLCVYSGSSDSDSSSDSEGSVDAIMSPYPRHNRAYR